MYIPINLEEISNFVARNKEVIFLDTALPNKHQRHSYLFTQPMRILCARNYTEVQRLLTDLERYATHSWVCGYLAYEAAYALEDHFRHLRKKRPTGELPLGWFGVFKKPYIFDHVKGIWDRPLPRGIETSPGGSEHTTARQAIRLRHTLAAHEYGQKIQEIKKSIARGETYQTNYTYDVSVATKMPAFDLYRHLRMQQPTPYCAFLKHSFGHVLSFSPELFFAKAGRHITVQPMKGTAERCAKPEEDRKMRRALSLDTKNNAENIMIVDLLRNDLGRVCEKKSITAPALFTIETLPSVHQMTSTVTGTLQKGVGLQKVIKSLFPCGSVTGAPKIRTMEIIRKLERGPRRVYCGMLGYARPFGKALFNVPIRTLQKTLREKSWQYRVGSGIVWGSTPAQEWHECRIKCSFLESANSPTFSLIESLRWNGRALVYLDAHLKRMERSALSFGFLFSHSLVARTLARLKNELMEKMRHRQAKARVVLEKTGFLQYTYEEIEQTNLAMQEIILQGHPKIKSDHACLYHKTNYHPWYDSAHDTIIKGRCFDVIFVNENDEITEGSRSNIFVMKGGKLYTPPVACGLLPGVLRMRLLQQKKCTEKVLYKEDVLAADALYCGNSVRGLVPVRLKGR